MTRVRLPNRRLSDRLEFEHQGQRFTAELGLYPDGRPGEVFLSSVKISSPMDIIVRDSAIAASLALQHGCPIDVLQAALLRQPDGTGAGPLSKALALLSEAPDAAAVEQGRAP